MFGCELQMLEGEFARLLRIRFDERNGRVAVQLAEEKQGLNARGLLNSSELARAIHRVSEDELRESAGVVVATALDICRKKNLLPNVAKIEELCVEALEKRKDEIEALCLSGVRRNERGLQNTAMLQPFLSLGDFYRLQREEMLVNLSIAHEGYMRDRGGDLTSMIMNRFKNRPIVAWGVIVITVLLAVGGLLHAIGELRRLLH